MPSQIRQKLVFRNTSAMELYELYMSSKKHTASTGSPAQISTKIGGRFKAYEEYATGENLLLIKDKLIMQTWRASDWAEKEPDSTFMIYLDQKGKDTTLHMVQAHVPDDLAESLGQGWHDFYWKPWRVYLKGRKK